MPLSRRVLMAIYIAPLAAINFDPPPGVINGHMALSSQLSTTHGEGDTLEGLDHDSYYQITL